MELQNITSKGLTAKYRNLHR